MFIQFEKQLTSNKKQNWKKLNVKRRNVDEEDVIPKEKNDGEDIASNRT